MRRVELTGNQFNDMILAYQDVGFPSEFKDAFFSVANVTLKPEVHSLPEHCTFNGYLDASQSKLTEFNHTANGDVTFAGCKTLQKIGPDASFGGYFNGFGIAVTEFNHPVAKHAILANCPKLEKIGPDARIGGKLTVTNAPAFKEFDGYVQGDADFTGSQALAKLGPQSHVAGHLNLEGTAVPLTARPKLSTTALDDPKTPLSIRLPGRESFTEALHRSGLKVTHDRPPSVANPRDL